ncbi:MAG TPA: tetratricopeptide repeat protein [Spirochaetota bacterium]|nr:tetratricopeptide repeat protein [Spirochaetota bacterium]HOL57452.1 tetratricopeptide repeat protein [Spirochaetota bacterium]HPP03622.1 tetratricopeptide repeat protein [Spirochaetota bacterium]
MLTLIINTILIIFGIAILIAILIVLIKKIFESQKIYRLQSAIKSENYKTAIKLAKEILAKEPNNIEAHFFLGEAYYFENKFELALIEYKSASRTGITSKLIKENMLRERLGELFERFENIEEALKEYLLLLNKNPTNYFYSFKIATLFEKKNMREQAIKYYTNCLKFNDSYVPALINLGVLLYESKKYVEAGKLLEKALKLEPNNNSIYFYLGMLRKLEGNYKNALQFFDKAIRDKDFKVKSLTEKGMILMQINKYDEALIELERAVKNIDEKMEKENLNFVLNLRYILAACYEQNRNITEAIREWEWIYTKKPDFKNVAEKLSNYQDLRMNDKMKDFMTATQEDFIEICKTLVNGMGLNITDFKVLTNDCVEFYTLEGDNKWRNVRKRPKLIRIYRKSEPITDLIVRNVHEVMKSKDIIKGVVITSSFFNKYAILFAQERPIELIDKNGLQNLLNTYCSNIK